MRLHLLTLTVAALAFTLPASVTAQDRERPAVRQGISEARALQIARGYGMVRVDEIEQDDGGWEIEGRDQRGRKLEIDINRDGRVTRVDRSNDRDDDD